jgi:hypothetical protein
MSTRGLPTGGLTSNLQCNARVYLSHLPPMLVSISHICLLAFLISLCTKLLPPRLNSHCLIPLLQATTCLPVCPIHNGCKVALLQKRFVVSTVKLFFVSISPANIILRIQKIDYFLYRLFPADTQNRF